MAASPGRSSISSTNSSRRSAKDNATPAAHAAGVRSFYGRRLGHRLRPAQQALLDEWLPRIGIAIADTAPASNDPRTLFTPTTASVWLEIGYGGGEHLVAQANAHPAVGLIGCEPYLNGIASLVRQVAEGEQRNIRIFGDDARLLIDTLTDASIDRAFLLFPDPWPKVRHHKRRFVQPGNLDALARILSDGAEFIFATDHMGYARWALAHLTVHPAFEWLVKGPSDWRAPPVGWQATRYEAKSVAQGLPRSYLRFRRIPRAVSVG